MILHFNTKPSCVPMKVMQTPQHRLCSKPHPKGTKLMGYLDPCGLWCSHVANCTQPNRKVVSCTALIKCRSHTYCSAPPLSKNILVYMYGQSHKTYLEQQFVILFARALRFGIAISFSFLFAQQNSCVWILPLTTGHVSGVCSECLIFYKTQI